MKFERRVAARNAVWRKIYGNGIGGIGNRTRGIRQNDKRFGDLCYKGSNKRALFFAIQRLKNQKLLALGLIFASFDREIIILVGFANTLLILLLPQDQKAA